MDRGDTIEDSEHQQEGSGRENVSRVRGFVQRLVLIFYIEKTVNMYVHMF